jgi:hypothetical protein
MLSVGTREQRAGGHLEFAGLQGRKRVQRRIRHIFWSINDSFCQSWGDCGAVKNLRGATKNEKNTKIRKVVRERQGGTEFRVADPKFDRSGRASGVMMCMYPRRRMLGWLDAGRQPTGTHVLWGQLQYWIQVLLCSSSSFGSDR